MIFFSLDDLDGLLYVIKVHFIAPCELEISLPSGWFLFLLLPYPHLGVFKLQETISSLALATYKDFRDHPEYTRFKTLDRRELEELKAKYTHKH